MVATGAGSATEVALQEGPGRWSRRQVLRAACASGVAAAAGVPLWRAEPGPRTLSRGRGTWTSTGSVALLGAVAGAAPAPVHGHGAAEHSPWATALRVEVEVHNGSHRPVLLSGGQFRLRVDGRSVTPYGVGRTPGAVEPGQTVRTWVSWLAPGAPAVAVVEYQDPMSDAPLALTVPVRQEAGA